MIGQGQGVSQHQGNGQRQKIRLSDIVNQIRGECHLGQQGGQHVLPGTQGTGEENDNEMS